MKQFRIFVVVFMVLLTACGNPNSQKTDDLIAVQEQNAAPNSVPALADSSNNNYDVDLTELDSNMLYAQVYNMAFGDTDYNGKLVRAKGSFAYYLDESTKKEYFAVLISDAAACCAQGIEFELAEPRKYPEEYPEIGTQIVVHGTFNTYEDETGAYVQLRNAVLE